MASDSDSSKRTLDSSESDDSVEIQRLCKAITGDSDSCDAVESPNSPLPREIPTFPLELHQSQALLTPDRVTWPPSLLPPSERDVTQAMVAAASHGHLHLVLELLHQLKPPQFDYLSRSGYQILKQAVLPAARNGHRDVVARLLQWLEVDDEIDRETAWKALDEAAASGQLEVVQFLAKYVIRSKEDEEQCRKSRAVSCAIAAGHAHVVAHLLRYPWNLAAAFTEAVERQQHLVAMKIYAVYPLYYGGKNLFVDMAGDGFTNAVKYMFVHGYIQFEHLQDAFVKAAVSRRTAVLDFLLSTRKVSMSGFERALAAAATSGSIAAVTYLYNKHLVSLEGIYQAFEVAGSLAVSAFLYKMEEIPASSVTAAFENVTGIGATTIPMQRKDRETLAMALAKKRCIHPDVLCTAFAMTKYDMVNLVGTLFDNPCISHEVVYAALQNAADCGHVHIVRFLMGTVGFPHHVLQVALLNAARNNHLAVVRLLTEYQNWSFDALTSARKSTTSPKLKGFCGGKWRVFVKYEHE